MAIVEVTLGRHDHIALKQFNELMILTPEVMQCYSVTGAVDFFVVMTTKDMQEFDALTTVLFAENALVKLYKSSIVMKPVKTGLSIPLELAARGA